MELKHVYPTILLVISCLLQCLQQSTGQRFEPRPAARQFSARAMKNAADAITSGIQTRIANQDNEGRRALSRGIDRKGVRRTDHAGPQHLTTRVAMNIERAGRAFLETTIGTAKRLNMPVGASRGVSFKTAMIRPPPKFLNLCPFRQSSWPVCDHSTPYRTPDGSCNNLDNPLWGRSQTPFERVEDPAYDDGLSSPRTTSTSGGTLPNARTISHKFHSNLQRPEADLNHMVMEFGQLISHDIQFNALSRGYQDANLECCLEPNRHNCFPIMIPPGDPFFPANRTCMNVVRSLPTPDLSCTLGVRQQLNQNTHYLDGSMVYGSDKETADGLRTLSGGLLQESVNDNLPTNTGTNAGCISSGPTRPCFRAGDRRVNQQPALMAMTTIFHREHNRLASSLSALNPSWNDEKLYQEARRINIALLQHITYNEYLPEILGNQAMYKYGLRPRNNGFYNGYSSTFKPMIWAGFMVGAYRFGHSMIRHTLPTHNGASQTTVSLLKDAFLRPDLVYTRGVTEITRGLTRSTAETVDKHVTEQVTRHLFERQAGFGGDLAAINIQRGRDHGVPNYQVWRRHCGLRGQFSHSFSVRQQLQNLYSSPDDMDLFTAGVSETPVPGGKVGPTFACLIGEQFQALKKGDRFFYENIGPTGFTSAQLAEIREQSLAMVICRNTDISSLQRRALQNIRHGNQVRSCQNLPRMSLAAWKSGGGVGCVPVHGGWSSWQNTGCVFSWRLRYRVCNNPTPNRCGRPCSSPYQFEVHPCGGIDFIGGRPMDSLRSRNAGLPSLSKSSVLSKVTGKLAGMIGKQKNGNIKASAFESALTSAVGHSPTRGGNPARASASRRQPRRSVNRGRQSRGRFSQRRQIF